ncbi:hypothetical protein MNAN1_001155 [Malassezia nana]|uniref:H/ACA ribonucleoprotein complex non-core subunit NAF1 n=1 Tax=Malassezia nana TaxID=180528 RepID=A0AAF0EKR7_9BASI|nr:hypothetical protein MNAN1_001155 [Malassezia nana]
MGAEQSRLRFRTNAAPATTEEDADTSAPSSSNHAYNEPAAEQAVTSDETRLNDGQVSGPDDTMPSSAAVAAHASEESSTKTLSEHRKLVQILRLEQGSLGSSDAQILEEMDRAGVADTRLEEHVALQGEEQEESDSSESDSDTSGSDSSSDTDTVMEVKGEEDDEGQDSSAPPRTRNEFGEDYIVEPAIQKIDEEQLSSIEYIGCVHSIVGNVVLVEQDSSTTTESSQRHYDVLDSESLLCFEDGSVLGLVYETFGSIKQPMYSVRFRTAEAIDRERVQEKKPVYFLPASSTYVLTKLIRTKGSDASNVWDEEVADDEVEYSDDEAEAVAKKARKGKNTRSTNSTPTDAPAHRAMLEADASDHLKGSRIRTRQAGMRIPSDQGQNLAMA